MLPLHHRRMDSVVVRSVGFEPTRLAARGFRPPAATNYARNAYVVLQSGARESNPADVLAPNQASLLETGTRYVLLSKPR